jgi:autotransporter-associated beta strand protein
MHTMKTSLNPLFRKQRLIFTQLSICLFIIFCNNSVFAQKMIYDASNAANPNSWTANNGENWNNNMLPVSTSNLYFTSDEFTPYHMSIGMLIAAKSITFEEHFNFLDSTYINAENVAKLTLSNDFLVANNATMGTVTFLSPELSIELLGEGIFHVEKNAELAFDVNIEENTSASISASNEIKKSGFGALTLSGQNNFTMPFHLLEGVLNINSSNALGKKSDFIVGGGIIDNKTNHPLTVSDHPIFLENALKFWGSNDLLFEAAPIHLMGGLGFPAIDVVANKLTLEGDIQGKLDFMKKGIGTLILTGASSYSRNTIVEDGVLELNHVGGGTLPSNTDIYLKKGDLVVKTSQICKNIILEADANLIIENGAVLTISGTFEHKGGNVSIFGTGHIAYNDGSKLSMSGINPQAIDEVIFPTTASPTNLAIDNSAGVTIFNNTVCNITGNLALKNGVLAGKTGNPSLIHAVNGTVTRTNGTYVGSFGKLIDNGTTICVFPIGDATSYHPATLTYTIAPSAPSMLIATYKPTPPTTVGIPLEEGTVKVTEISNSGFWNIENNTFTPTGVYTISVDATGFRKADGSPILNLAEVRLVKRPSDGVWASSGGVSAAPLSLSNVQISGLKSFSDFALGTATTVLPIELSSFSARKNNHQVVLDFSTATEINNDYFSIERSSDGKRFEEIGIVEGFGTSKITKYYSFKDEKPLSGNNYYRLKQFDFDGRYSYSAIKTVYFVEKTLDAQVIFAKKENIRLNLNTENNLDATIKIFATNGQLINFYNVSLMAKYENLIELNTDLLNGIYIVQIIAANGETISKKVAVN